MRDQPHAWQHRSDDTAESATGVVPAPDEGTDEPGPIEGIAAARATADETGHDEVDGESVNRDVADNESVDRESIDSDTAGTTTQGLPASGESATVGRVLDEPVLERSDRDRPGDAASFDRTALDRTPPDATTTGDPAGPTGEPASGTAAGDAAPTGVATGDGAGTGTATSDAATGTAAGQASDGELLPGDIPEQPMSALFEGSAADGFRDRWQRVQLRFVDNPRGAADEARVLTDEVVSALHAALNERISSLGEWRSGRSSDTEELRVAVRRYRDLLDRLLGL